MAISIDIGIPKQIKNTYIQKYKVISRQPN